MATIISTIKADVQAYTELHTTAHLKAYWEDLAHTLASESSITNIDYDTLFSMYLDAIHNVMLSKIAVIPSAVAFTTLMTNRKYMVIASASRSNLSAYNNMMRFSTMMETVKNTLPKKDYAFIIPVMEFYREEGIDHKPVSECFEQSVMLGTNSLTKLNELLALFVKGFQQECILVQDNDLGNIMLMGDGWSETIGNAWNFYGNVGADIEAFATDHNAFTILPSGQVVEVIKA